MQGEQNIILPGSRLVRTTGIIMTVIYILVFIAAIVILLVASIIFGIISAPEGDTETESITIIDSMNKLFNVSAEISPAFSFFFVGFIVNAILYIAFGISGIVFAGKTEKANVIIAFGYILVAIALINCTVYMLFLYEGINIVTMFATLLTCILPSLYIIGGYRMRKPPGAPWETFS